MKSLDAYFKRTDNGTNAKTDDGNGSSPGPSSESNVKNLSSKRTINEVDQEAKEKINTEEQSQEQQEQQIATRPAKKVKGTEDDVIVMNIEAGWKMRLETEVSKPYYRKLQKYLQSEFSKPKAQIFPPRESVFAAFDLCPFEETKVVIIGQDPYHGPDQAHGLAFSVTEKVAIPPSLRNIFKEAVNDVGIRKPTTGNLVPWARQGVLLLNTVLTVRKGEANSHKNQGWEAFTDAVIQKLNKEKEGLVFLLWGKPAQTKGAMVNQGKHHVIKSSHPSPLGATKTSQPFIGSKCFSRANAYLKKLGKPTIDWSIP